jgi:hypothetical protein
MIMRKSNKKDGEPLTLDGLMTELNNLFASRKDDPKAVDIKSMIQSLVNGEACFDEKAEDDAMTACPDGLDLDGIDLDGIDISNEDLSGGMIGYNSITEASKADGNIMTTDIYGVDMPIIAFIAPNHMMEGVVETIRSMARPLIVAKECVGGAVNVIKASIACGNKRETLIKKNGTINALVFDEKSGMCRLSINRKDGYDFICGENGVTRFIIFDETVCPATIPTDIVSDDRKWGKRMTSELPKLIEKRIEESKSEEKLPFADAVTPALTKIDIPMLDKKTPLCNLPETCTFENTPYANIKQPVIADIMKDFADAKSNGKVGKDTFVEFMKPENKNAVANAVATSIAERKNRSEDVIEKDEVTKAVESAIFEDDSDDFTDEDTNPDCFRCIAEYMAKEGVDSVHFYTDVEGLIHCDVQLKTVYKVELDDSDKK